MFRKEQLPMFNSSSDDFAVLFQVQNFFIAERVNNKEQDFGPAFYFKHET